MSPDTHLRRQVRPNGSGTRADVAQHLVGLVPLIAVLVTVGRPILWLAALLPLGPLLLGPLLGRGPVSRLHRREALGFSVTVASAYMVIAVGLTSGASTPVLVMLIPPFSLGIPVVTLAWLTLSLMAAARARHGILMAYPFVVPLFRHHKEY